VRYTQRVMATVLVALSITGLPACSAIESVSAASDKSIYPERALDGQSVAIDEQGNFQVWDEVKGQWVLPETFWTNFADRKGGITWGRSDSYPPYHKVKEHDLILIELDSGLCLMEFYHQRWRRASDVWRWGRRISEYGGCPNVFK